MRLFQLLNLSSIHHTFLNMFTHFLMRPRKCGIIGKQGNAINSRSGRLFVDQYISGMHPVIIHSRRGMIHSLCRKWSLRSCPPSDEPRPGDNSACCLDSGN